MSVRPDRSTTAKPPVRSKQGVAAEQKGPPQLALIQSGSSATPDPWATPAPGSTRTSRNPQAAEVRPLSAASALTSASGFFASTVGGLNLQGVIRDVSTINGSDDDDLREEINLEAIKARKAAIVTAAGKAGTIRDPSSARPSTRERSSSGTGDDLSKSPTPSTHGPNGSTNEETAQPTIPALVEPVLIAETMDDLLAVFVDVGTPPEGVASLTKSCYMFAGTKPAIDWRSVWEALKAVADHKTATEYSKVKSEIADIAHVTSTIRGDLGAISALSATVQKLTATLADMQKNTRDTELAVQCLGRFLYINGQRAPDYIQERLPKLDFQRLNFALSSTISLAEAERVLTHEILRTK